MKIRETTIQDWNDTNFGNDYGVFKETEKAVLIGVEEGVKTWIPKSQVAILKPFGRGPGSLLVKTWIADKKNLTG